MTAMTVHAASPDRMTADEFLAHDFPAGSELVDGVVYLDDPAFDHQEVARRILAALGEWALARLLGRAGFGGNWVLSDGHVYNPDVWWAAQRPRGTRHAGPPALAVEVRSPSTWARDVGPKLREYERTETTELWLVDHPARSVLVFRRRSGEPGFATAIEVGPGEVLTSPLLPGFSLSIDALFADLD